MDKPPNYNIPLGVGLAFFILILCLFFASLFGSREGEIASATGSVIGGIIGALGAALAVYLTLSLQKNRERENVTGIIVREVMDFSRLAIGHLENCFNIANGVVRVPIAALPNAMQMPDPIIYRAVADRLALARSPQQIVSFYTRISEIKTILAVMAEHPLSAQPATREKVDPLARAWMDILQIAKGIVDDNDPVPEFDYIVRKHIQTEIRHALTKGHSVFPEPQS